MNDVIPDIKCVHFDDNPNASVCKKDIYYFITATCFGGLPSCRGYQSMPVREHDDQKN